MTANLLFISSLRFSPLSTGNAVLCNLAGSCSFVSPSSCDLLATACFFRAAAALRSDSLGERSRCLEDKDCSQEAARSCDQDLI